MMSKNESDKPKPKVTSAGVKNPPRMGSTILQRGGDGLYSNKADKIGGPIQIAVRHDREQRRKHP